jgi:amino acid permease
MSVIVSMIVIMMVIVSMIVIFRGERRHWKQHGSRYCANEREFANHLVLHLLLSHTLGKSALSPRAKGVSLWSNYMPCAIER